MLDLSEELAALVAALNAEKIDYALCGGLAMAVYAAPRATLDIDLLAPPESLEKIAAAARDLGYIPPEGEMTFADGRIVIHRFTKLDPESEDFLALDILVVSPELLDVWNGRTTVRMRNTPLTVVSREGLIRLKKLRANAQDLADIERLEEMADED